MTKLISLLLLIVINIFAIELPTKKATLKSFNQTIKANAKIVQLSNTKYDITTQIDAKVIKYFIQSGQVIKAGDKVALLESIPLSNLTAKFLSLKKSYQNSNNNFNIAKKLNKKGLISTQELNKQSSQNSEITAKYNSIKANLEILGFNPDKLSKPTSKLILFATTSGKIATINRAINSQVTTGSKIATIVSSSALYLKSYLPLKIASKIKIGQKIVVNKNIKTTIKQILPEVDSQTKQIVVLSDIPTQEGVFINSYLPVVLHYGDSKEYVSVKKSALSFLNNEWVVFIPKEHEHEHKHEEEVGHEEEEELAYDIKVVKIIVDDGEYVGVLGLKKDEEYISDKSYYVKALVLKSSLGGHGH